MQRVGIFWGVPDGSRTVLVHDAIPLSEGEPYGETLTYPGGHADVWEGWAKMGVTGLKRRGLPAAIAYAEYDAVPRGRVVYMNTEKQFVIYADRQLHTAPFIRQVKDAFGLTEAQSIVRSDPHYRT
jgi:hypothetical protein